MKPKSKCQKLQFLEWQLQAGTKSETIPADFHIKSPNFKEHVLQPGTKKAIAQGFSESDTVSRCYLLGFAQFLEACGIIITLLNHI